jgi:hypothetical protein
VENTGGVFWCGWWCAGDFRVEVGLVECEERGVGKIWLALAALGVEALVLTWAVGAHVWDWSGGVLLGQ